MVLRDAYRQLLDGAEQHVREREAGDEAAQMLRDIAAFRPAVEFPREEEVLHAMEKFLFFALHRAVGDERLRAELEPFIGMARAARERLGGSSVLPR